MPLKLAEPVTLVTPTSISMADKPTETTRVRTSIKVFPKAVALEAMQGVQGGRAYWCAQVPLIQVVNLFVFHEDVVNPGFEVQRQINKTRVKKIANYIKENLETYVFNGITVSIDSATFEPIHPESSIGTLYVGEGSRYLINDGQHRISGIQQVLQDPEMREALEAETITVDFRIGASITRQRQIFSDLNLNVTKPAKGLSHYFSSGDKIAEITRAIAYEVPQFKGRVNFQKNQLNKKDPEMWTFKGLYDAVKASIPNAEDIDPDAVIDHWIAIAKQIQEWQPGHPLNSDDALLLRETNICFSSVGVTAIGKAFPVGKTVPLLENFGWDRRCDHWQGACIVDGKLRKNAQAIAATAKLISQNAS